MPKGQKVHWASSRGGEVGLDEARPVGKLLTSFKQGMVQFEFLVPISLSPFGSPQWSEWAQWQQQKQVKQFFTLPLWLQQS